MKKMPSVFKRDYDGNRQVYDEVVPGCEWVLAGEGRPTEKFDGTSCMIREGKLYKRYDRKYSKKAFKRHVKGEPWKLEDLRPAPEGWEACEEAPNLHTGHWPGWLLVGDGPEDHCHRDASVEGLADGTYELVGPKVQSNPYKLDKHELWKHGMCRSELLIGGCSFNAIKACLERYEVEGIVYHHPDGRMAKVKRRDFGFEWPVKEQQ